MTYGHMSGGPQIPQLSHWSNAVEPQVVVACGWLAEGTQDLKCLEPQMAGFNGNMIYWLVIALLVVAYGPGVSL